MAVAIVQQEPEATLAERVEHLFPWSGDPVLPAPAPVREPISKTTIDMMAALASVLSARLALLLAVVGAFVLAVLVIQSPSVPALVALGLFSALVVPLAWLSQKRVT